MLRALAAILITTLFAFSAGAQSYVESNARDTVCEWQYKLKRGIDKCHIIAMGTHSMGDLVLMFTVDNMVVSLITNEEQHYKRAEIGQGGFWNFKSKWKGTYTDKFEWIGDPETTPISVNTIRLSNGYTIKLVY
jgi:hypothetical protein